MSGKPERTGTLRVQLRIVLALVLVLLAAPTALAQQPGPQPQGDVALGLRFGDGAFRLNGRFATTDGFLGFWLDGAQRDRGLTVQGRVERDGRSFNFSLDADRNSGGTLRWWQDPL